MRNPAAKTMIMAVLCFIAAACNPVRPDNPTSIPSPAPSANLPTATDPEQTSTNSQHLGEFAYLSDRTGLVELWLYDLSTGVSRQLTQSDCPDKGQPHGSFRPGVQFFTWSPNGQRIAYAIACSFYDPAKMLVLDLNADKITMVGIGDRYSSYPSWSPNGTRFVFGRGVPGFSEWKEQGIYLVNLQENSDPVVGKIARVIPEEYCYHGCLYTTWSPDGKYIVYQGARVTYQFSRNPASIADAEQYLSDDQSTTPIVQLIGIHDVSPRGLTWSPNGQLLAIATVHGYSGVAYLTVVSISDPGRSKFYLNESLPDSPSLFGPGFYAPVFSPDSAAVYFVANPVDSTGDWPGPFGIIYRVPISADPKNPAKDVQAVSEVGQLAGFLSLSHDGKWLAYTVLTDATLEIWLQTSDGQVRQKIVGDGYLNTQPAWQPVE